MTVIESAAANLNDEAFADLMLSTFEKVARTRSDQKRSRFAEIITNQVANPMPWEEPENAVRLLSDLEDILIKIIEAALGAPIAEGAFSGLRVISLDAEPIDSGEKMYPSPFLPRSRATEQRRFKWLALSLRQRAFCTTKESGAGTWER